MVKVSIDFKRFISRGLHRCKHCKYVLYIIDDSRSVCLNCGAYYVSNHPKSTNLFDTCSVNSRGKGNHEI